MGVWSRFVGGVRALIRPDPAQHLVYMVPYAAAGVRLTEEETLQLSAVWGCIDAIGKAIASCDWNIFEPQARARREQLYDDPLHWVLNTRPNPELTAIALREFLLYQAIPYGNAYAEIVKDRAGRVAQLWPLDQARVRPRRDAASQQLVYDYLQPDGTVVTLAASRVFHLRGPSIDGLLGDNLVARAAKSLSAAAAAERYTASFFGRGAQPGGVIEVPGKLDPDTHKRLKADWEEKRGGPENAHRPLFLEGGWKFTPVTTEPGKSQLVESRQFSVEEICRWFGVPPHKVQHLLRATFSNIEHLSIEFVRDALRPWCKRLEQEADFKLFPQARGPWRFTEIDTAPLSFGDALSRAQAHAVWRQNGIMSANEIRMREGLNDAGDDGDVLLVQSNLTTVQRLLAPPAPAPALPAGDLNEDDDLDPSTKDTTAEDAQAIARQSFTALMGGALDRYARRLANRRADLQRKLAPAEVENRLAEEREHQLPQLVNEVFTNASLAFAGFGQVLTSQHVTAAAELAEQQVPGEAAVGQVLSAPARRVAA